MIEAALVLFLLGILFVVVVPLLVVGAMLAVLLKVLLAIILLPLKAIGLGLAGLFDGFFFLLKAVGILLIGGLLLSLVLIFLAVPLISMAPVLLLAGLVWCVWKLARPSSTPVRS